MLAIGSSVGPYTVLRRLGAGGMGEVYLATDTRLGRKVALKSLVTTRFLGSEQARRALLREARAAACLNHPNIATLYDVVEGEDTCVIVMEYVQGETLAARLTRGPLPMMEAVAVGMQLAEGLEAAHASGIVHRDLKPSNAALSDGGRVKMLDFGLARHLVVQAPGAPGDGIERESLSGSSSWNEMAVGTLPYMAPEQVVGEPGDERSDIYGLGVVLFEMLTGRRPFDATDRATLARSILSDRTPTVSDFEPAVDAGLDRLVRQAMTRAAGTRTASARQLRTELAQVSRELESSTRSFSLPGRSGRRDDHGLRRRFLVAGLPLVAAIALLLHLTAPPPSSSEGPLMVAVLPLLNTSGDLRDEPLAAGIGEVLSSALVKVDGIGVVPTAATRQYHAGRDLRRIARDLGVSWLVDGGVQRSGDALRVTLTLVEGPTLVARWSQSFDGAGERVFDLQNDVATGVAAALDVSLSSWERRRLSDAPTRSGEAFGEYAQGRALLDRPDRSGNVERAIAALGIAIQKDTRFALAHAALGEAYWMRFLQTHDPGLTLRARDAVARAVALDRGHPLVHYSLALICERTGRLDQAIEAAQRALTLQPRNDDARRLLGRVFNRKGRFEEGMSAFSAALAVRPRYWKNHEELGLGFYDRGRLSEALASFREVTHLQPDNSWGFYLVAMTHLARGELDPAGRALEEAMALSPDALAHSGRGYLRFQKGEDAEAAADFARAIELEPNPVDYRNLGDTLVRQGKRDKAREAYEKALALGERQVAADPGDARALALLSVYEAKLGRFDDAGRHAADATDRTPWDADVHYRRAVVAALEGRSAEALTSLEAALGRGWSEALVRMDPDLSGLRGLEGYGRALALYEGREP